MPRLGFVVTMLFIGLFTAPTALAAPIAQDARETLPWLWWLTPIGSGIALVVAYLLYRSVMTREEGTARMIEIAQAVREGAMAYLSRQYRIVAIVFAVLFVILLIMSLAGESDRAGLCLVPEPGRPAKSNCTLCLYNRRLLLGVVRFYRYENGHQRLGPNRQRRPAKPERWLAGRFPRRCGYGLIGGWLCPARQ